MAPVSSASAKSAPRPSTCSSLAPTSPAPVNRAPERSANDRLAPGNSAPRALTLASLARTKLARGASTPSSAALEKLAAVKSLATISAPRRSAFISRAPWKLEWMKDAPRRSALTSEAPVKLAPENRALVRRRPERSHLAQAPPNETSRGMSFSPIIALAGVAARAPDRMNRDRARPKRVIGGWRLRSGAISTFVWPARLRNST